MIVLNKWDLLSDAEARAQVAADVADRLSFLGYAPVLKVSARTGLGVHKLLPAIGHVAGRGKCQQRAADVDDCIRKFLYKCPG